MATRSITSRQTPTRTHDAAYDQLSQKLTTTETKLVDTQTALVATQERTGQLENMVLTLRQQVQQPSTRSAPSMPSHVPPVVPGAADFGVDEAVNLCDMTNLPLIGGNSIMNVFWWATAMVGSKSKTT
ncbi:hypothetical protein LINPERPRIM_LOCUS26161 [Linum perenne]